MRLHQQVSAVLRITLQAIVVILSSVSRTFVVCCFNSFLLTQQPLRLSQHGGILSAHYYYCLLALGL